jgi:hypothetical protein
MDDKPINNAVQAAVRARTRRRGAAADRAMVVVADM